MSGTVYTVASGKGGVGKTTTSVNLAVALWQEGNAVALVDADIGMANLAAVLNLEPEATLHDVLSGRATVEEALVEAQGGNLLVLPGDRSLESFADADPRKLRAAVGELAERCDYVIVDTGAGLSYEDVLPLGMAHGVLLVTTPDPAAFGDTRKTMEVADLLGAPIRGLVVTRAVADTDSEAIAGEIGAELLGTVPEDPAVMASTVAGNPLESHAPDSEAAAAYRDVAAALLAGDEEWLEAHPSEPAEPPVEDVAVAAEPDETPAVGDSPADDGTPVDDDSPGDDSTAAGDATDAGEEAGEAWAAANEEPVGAEESSDFGDIMVEPGEASEAEVRPERASTDDDGAGGTEDGPDSRGEGGTTSGESETGDADAAADDATTDETAPSGEPDEPWAVSADDLEAETRREPGGSTASSAEPDDVAAEEGAAADRAGTEGDEADEEPGEAGAGDDVAEPDGEGGADGDLVEGTAEQDEETADVDEEEGAGEPDEEGEEETADVDEEEEAGEPDEEGEEETADVDEEEQAEEEEARGGFFGWLGRLFS